MGVNSLPKTVTRQRRSCDLNPGPSAPESSTLTTRLPSHSFLSVDYSFFQLQPLTHRTDSFWSTHSSEVIASVAVDMMNLVKRHYRL